MSPNPKIRRSASRQLALVGLLSGIRLAPAWADSADVPTNGALHLESSTCSHALVDEVQRFTRIELKNTSTSGGETAPRVILSCSEHVSLIRALVNGHESSRQLDLDLTEAALRPRVIALAIAELVRDTARGEAVEPPEVSPPAPVKPAPEVEPAPSERPRAPPTSRLVVLAKLENFGGSFQPLSGGGLGFSHDVGRLSFGLGPALATGQRNFALGSVHVLAADLSLRLALRFPNRALPGEIGIGHALGLARVTGAAAGAATNDAARVQSGYVTGAWAGPFLFGTLDVSVADPLFLEVAAQLGVVTFPVSGEVSGESDVKVAGLWSGVSLGLGLNL
ncbi:MAG TPA: hypothetical protein VK745_01555 [Polyangiaceae bacterium]|nr:hypothetical protein [Polyangiaceae bacterium]